MLLLALLFIQTGERKTGDIWAQHKAFRIIFFKKSDCLNASHHVAAVFDLRLDLPQPHTYLWVKGRADASLIPCTTNKRMLQASPRSISSIGCLNPAPKKKKTSNSFSPAHNALEDKKEQRSISSGNFLWILLQPCFYVSSGRLLTPCFFSVTQLTRTLQRDETFLKVRVMIQF